MTTDKLDTHYFQQLSALMDGDLAPDQARFLLRRLEHDNELTGCWERWQLCGDVLRGQAQAPAPAGFAGRIAAAIAVESLQSAASTAAGASRSTLARWGGGALAASVAVIALFMVRQQVPDEAPIQAAPTMASQSPGSVSAATSSDSSLQKTAATVTAASVAVASLPRRQNEARRSATRSQQSARNAAATRASSSRAVASASVPVPVPVPVIHAIAGAPAAGASRDPFSNVQLSAPARPWPRSVLPQYSPGSGAFNADYSTDRATQAFYPFEPRLQESPPVNLPEPSTR